MPVYKKYNKEFFLSWSANMAYVLGLLCADGNIVYTKRGTHFIAWYSADYSLLMSVRNILGSEHRISVRRSDTGAVYRLQIGSKYWFAQLQKLNIQPRKSARMRVPQMPKLFQKDFLRGYFDGDGNVWSGYINRTRTTPTPVLIVAFTSASQHFLSDLHSILRLQGIQGGSVFTHKTKSYSRLSFSTRDALKIYKIMYTVPHKLFLKRKKKVFDQFIQLRTQR
jgi:hypothetical protein